MTWKVRRGMGNIIDLPWGFCDGVSPLVVVLVTLCNEIVFQFVPPKKMLVTIYTPVALFTCLQWYAHMSTLQCP